jgi:dihydrofolate reductase
MRKVKLFIATSLDGFIAKPDGNIDWLSMVEKPGEDYGYAAFDSTTDTVIMGRKTYEKVLSFGIEYPHKNKQSYIITQTLTVSGHKDIHYYGGDIAELIGRLKQQPGKDIFVDGGAQLVNAMMKENLIEEFIISTLPIFLGQGIRLFEGDYPGQKLKLLASTHFESGLVQSHYVVDGRE